MSDATHGRLAVIYPALRTTLAIFTPITRAAHGLLNAFTFDRTAPIISLVSLTILLFLAWHPQFILLACVIFAARSHMWQVRYRVKEHGQPKVADEEWRAMTIRAAQLASAPPPSLVTQAKRAAGAAIKSALQSINPMNLVPDILKAKKDTAQEAADQEHPDVKTLDRILRPHIRGALAMLGIHWDENSEMFLRCQTAWTAIAGRLERAYLIFTGAAGTGGKEGETFVSFLISGIVWSLMWPTSYLIIILCIWFMVEAYVAITPKTTEKATSGN